MNPNMISDAGYITGSDAARRLGISRQHFYRLAKRFGWAYEMLLDVRLYQLADIRSYKPQPVGHPLASAKPTDDIEYSDNSDWTNQE